MIEGFGVHTFRMIDAAGASRLVKFHWRPNLGAAAVLRDEAVKLKGADPDFTGEEAEGVMSRNASACCASVSRHDPFSLFPRHDPFSLFRDMTPFHYSHFQLTTFGAARGVGSVGPAG